MDKKNKNIIYLVLIIAAIGAAFYVFSSKSDSQEGILGDLQSVFSSGEAEASEKFKDLKNIDIDIFQSNKIGEFKAVELHLDEISLDRGNPMPFGVKKKEADKTEAKKQGE